MMPNKTLPISSSPAAPTAITLQPSFAISTEVPAAVPAAVILISSIRAMFCPGGISETCLPNTSKMCTPMETIVGMITPLITNQLMVLVQGMLHHQINLILDHLFFFGHVSYRLAKQ